MGNLVLLLSNCSIDPNNFIVKMKLSRQFSLIWDARSYAHISRVVTIKTGFVLNMCLEHIRTSTDQLAPEVSNIDGKYPSGTQRPRNDVRETGS